MADNEALDDYKTAHLFKETIKMAYKDMSGASTTSY